MRSHEAKPSSLTPISRTPSPVFKNPAMASSTSRVILSSFFAPLIFHRSDDLNPSPSSKRKITFRVVISRKFFKKNQEWVACRDVGCDVPGGARGQTIKTSYARSLRFLKEDVVRRFPGVARAILGKKKAENGLSTLFSIKAGERT